MFPLVEQYEESSPDRCSVLCRARHLVWAAALLASEVSTGGCGSGAFVEIGRPVAGEEARVEIMYPGGIRVRLLAPVSASYLAQLVQS